MDLAKQPLNESATTRWAMMVVLSLAMAVNYYFYDALSPLKEVLTRELGFTSTQYGFMMSAYSFPNAFLGMAVIGGIILDRIGIRITGNVFFSAMVLGSFLTYYGATDYFNQGGLGYGFLNSFLLDYSPALKMMSLGFFLFGLGAETTCVVISKAVVKWFNGKELALALGLNIAIARGGTGLAMLISPTLIKTDWTQAIFLCFVLMAIGALAFIFYTFFDKKLDKQLVAAGKSSEDDEEAFRWADIWKLATNKSFIYITLLCVTFYSAVFPFIKYATDLLVNKFSMDLDVASAIVTILPFGTIVFTPIFGYICDNKGRSASLMFIGSGLLIVSHLLFSLTPITPYVPMFLLGVAFSLVPAAMWPSVAKLVDQSKIGTAYGLMFTVQNFGLLLFPFLIGLVLDISNPGVAEAQAAGEAAVFNYTNPILMLAVLGVAGFFFSFMLLRADKELGTGLELPNKQTD